MGINVLDAKGFADVLVHDYELWGNTVEAANIKAE